MSLELTCWELRYRKEMVVVESNRDFGFPKKSTTAIYFSTEIHHKNKYR